ncbi:MAG: PAS domain S-box protein [Methanoregula sp.]|jgi:PAS domain S-box-containing protein
MIDSNSIWRKTPGLDPRLALILIFMGMFAITGAFELGRDFFLPYVGIWQISLLTIIVVSASAAFIAFFPLRSLRTAEAQLDTLLNGSPTPQFVIDANHRVIFWNRALEIASGIKASEVYGTTDPWRASYAAKCPTLADLLVDGMIEQLPEMYKGKISRSQIIDGSYETLDFFPHIGKNGTWLHFTAIPVRDDKGVLLGAVETLIDVTERKRAEEALMANQFLLDDSMEMSHMAYWEYDQPSGIFTFNDRFYALYGTNADREGGYQMPADDYIKKFIHPEDIGRVQEVIAANSKGSQDSGTLSEVEHRIIRGDGKIRYINVCIRTVRDETGRTIRVNGANQDITDQRQAKIALEDAKKAAEKSLVLFTTLYENIPVGFGFIDTEFRVVLINRPFSEFRDIPLTGSIGKTLEELVPSLWSKLSSQYIRVLQTGQPVTGIERESSSRDRHGVIRHWLSNLYPVRTGDGTIIGIGTIVVEITELKKAEEALKESETQFLAFIKEAAMRLKNPLEVVEGNLESVVGDIDRGDVVGPNITLQLRLQKKNLEQIRNNIIELNKVIVDRSGEITNAAKKFLTE